MAKESQIKGSTKRKKTDKINTIAIPAVKASQLLHELQVHQIELEMQNEELRRVQSELSEQKERYFDLYDLAPVGYCTISQEGLILEANLTASKLFGISRNKLIHQPFTAFIFHEYQDDYYQYRKKFLESGGTYSCEIGLQNHSGKMFWAHLNASIAMNNDVVPVIRLVISDITEKKIYEEKLNRIAQYDSLTNLPNRLLLSDRLHQAMVQAQRYELTLAIIYLDLDGFKEINDTYGHDVGDQVLIELAQRMHNVLREGDTIARLGGDEFVALLLNLVRIEDAIPMLNRFLNVTSEVLEIDDLILQVSASIGVTFYPQKEKIDADLLLRQADQAMYQAKLAGRNRYHIFDIDQDSALREHYEFVEAMRHAFQEKEFILYYQPKVHMKTGSIIGVEALIRWQHPQKGLLAPSAFLPMIEDTSLCIEMGEWVIHTALNQIEQWHNEGFDICVSVNIGARQLQDDGFVIRLQEILAEHPNVTPSSLELEVLETTKIENLLRTAEIMRATQAFGVLFSLDDFGTGYSSLTYLQRLPIATIKIDQSFIHDMLNNQDDIAILSGIISLGNAFHLKIIAEGVETIEHGELLLKMGCDFAQGYAISPPIPPDEFSKWAKLWHPNPLWQGY